MENFQLVVGGIISLLIAGILRNTLFKEVIDQFVATDTSNWHWATAQVWEVFPILVIAAVLIVPILSILDGIE